MDTEDLYQELILDHGTAPRNCATLQDATNTAQGFNPLCGDKIQLYLKIQDSIIQAASFKGQGCAISTASASLMTEALKGKTLEEAYALFQAFQGLLTQEGPCHQRLGKLEALSGVKAFPARIKCATLAWHTLCEAINK